MTKCCDFCGKSVGSTEQVAFLSENGAAPLAMAGLKASGPPQFKDPSGRLNWVACMACMNKATSAVSNPAGAAGYDEKRAAEVAEKYISMDHPQGVLEKALGLEATKPHYEPAPGSGIGRGCTPEVDMKIVGVASCLPGESVNSNDSRKLGEMALKAIQHYANMPAVLRFFLTPYRRQGGSIPSDGKIPTGEQCRVYAGVENLLLEIYEDLGEGEVITDERVDAKISQLMESVQ